MTYKENISAQYQRQLDDFVHQHVSNNISNLVEFFASDQDVLLESNYSFEEDLMPILDREVVDRENQEFPQYVQALEHWIVSDWLAERLRKKDEMVGELFGLTIWGRTTSGQAISLDGVIQEIFQETQSTTER